MYVYLLSPKPVQDAEECTGASFIDSMVDQCYEGLAHDHDAGRLA